MDNNHNSLPETMIQPDKINGNVGAGAVHNRLNGSRGRNMSDNHGETISDREGEPSSFRHNMAGNTDSLDEIEGADSARELRESYLPRLVLRNRPFGQSANKVHIEHNQGLRIYSLLKHNWFHTMLRWPTSRSLGILMGTWTGMILLFATLYVWQDSVNSKSDCGLGPDNEPISFGPAFAFSLETCTTVGYGLPNGVNSYFEPECGSLQFLIYLQMAWSMVFNAFLLAFLYARFGRSETRSNQVINSRKALVSIVNGQVRFQVRLFDADAGHPVVEAHVRMYCVMNHRPVPRPLRLLQPDDELGGMLFLSFPTVISHHIDLYSLLHPPTAPPVGIVTPSGLVLRQVDGKTSSRDDVICPICGESYGHLGRWKNHVRYQQIAEAKDDFPLEGTHLSLNLDEIEKFHDSMTPTKDLKELKQFFRNNVSEVICVVEGIDPLQSGTFQSLHYYRYEDVVWDEYSQWAPCLTVVGQAQQKKTDERMFQVDLDRYHDIVPDEAALREKQLLDMQKRPEEETTAHASVHVSEILSASETSSIHHNGAALDVMPDINRVLSAVALSTRDDQATSDDCASEPAPTNRPRHRRVKSSSRRPGDALFVPTPEEIEEEISKKSHHPLMKKSLETAKSLPV